MALTPGTFLGPYQISAQIGVGGMGEVYQATDTNLKRQVAIKVLPAAVSADHDRLARFQREAEVLASLNHPNIAAIYGLEKSDATTALVMELVEGPTLAERIAEGPIPADDAVSVAKQIAEALEAAHEQGIVHRDLKPANVKVRPDGTVKVLDFGLAKAMEPVGTHASSQSMAPTITTPAMTQAGMILGTAAYMSPEQAKGRSADKRADIWAFGAVLYEMLTGTRAFGREDVAETLADVMRVEPAWDRLPGDLPPSLVTYLKRCLQKDPRQRVRDIGDVRLALSGAFEAPSVGTSAVTDAVPGNATAGRQRLAWGMAVAAAVLAGALAIPAARNWRAPTPPPTVRFEVLTPPTLNELIAVSIAVSPDGQWIAYVAQTPASTTALFLRAMESTTARQVTGTEGARLPFWSPDSRFVAFADSDQIKKIDVSGGPPQTISTLPGAMRGGTWNADGVLVFAADGQLFRVSAAGGEPAPLPLATESGIPVWPAFLPGGERFLYTEVVVGSADGSSVRVGALDSSQSEPLMTVLSKAVYAEPGLLVYQREGTLLAQPFDLETLEFSGEAVRIVDEVVSDVGFGAGAFSVSGTGTIAYRTGEPLGSSAELVWFAKDGTRLERAGEPAQYGNGLKLSPDGRQIGVNIRGDIWLMDWARGLNQRFTFDPGNENDLAWSPDGLRIAFTRDGNIFVQDTSGVGDAVPLVATDESDYVEDWSSDGRHLVYGKGGDRNLYVVSMDGESTSRPIVQSPFELDEAHFSPDGRWLSYNSNESGTPQVYVISFPEADQKRQMSGSGGMSALWRGDGRELYFLDPDGTMMAVDVEVRGEPAGGGVRRIDSGTPRALFETGLTPRPNLDQYAVTPDGKRFLVRLPLLDAEPTPITVALNWVQELARRAPAK